MNKDIKNIAIIFILFIIIDVPVVMILNKLFYQHMYNDINKGINVSTSRLLISGLGVYLVMSLGLYFLVLKNNKNKSDKEKFMNGMLFGLVLYGTYDMTNLATISMFRTKDAIIDIGWGMLLGGIMTLLSDKIIE